MEVKLIYETTDGKKHSKDVAVPKKRYGLGIVKQREGVVVIGYFHKSPDTHGYGKDNYVTKYVKVPANTKAGARLKVGSRVVSKAA